MKASTARGAALAALLLCVAGAGTAWWWLHRAPPAPTHTVVRGDTLWAIAKANGVEVAELRRWNALRGDNIDVGQVLVVGEGASESIEAPPTKAASTRTKRRPKARAARIHADAAQADANALAMPPAQPCLVGPQDVAEGGDDPAFAASAGLDGDQIRAALSAFESNLVRCLGADMPSGTADMELTVACTGRVSSVAVLDDGGLPDALVRCVADTLAFVPFPAHDMPDGLTIGYPVTVSP